MRRTILALILVLALGGLAAAQSTGNSAEIRGMGGAWVFNNGELRLYESNANGGNYFFQKAAASMAANIGVIWPAAACSGALTATNSSGTMTLTCTAIADMTSGTFSGTLSGPGGSNSAPSYSFTGDSNTGVYAPGADNVGIATGGTERVDITNGATAVKNVLSTGSTAVTIADSGDGSAATSTLTTPASSLYLYTCSDTDGCTLTLGETSVTTGMRLTIVNVSANAVTVADTSGVSETAGSMALGQWDSISYVYVTDRWVETSRSNN